MHRFRKHSAPGLVHLLRAVAVLLLTGFGPRTCLAVSTAVPDPGPADVTEQTVLASVRHLYGGSSRITVHLPLTEPFRATSSWELLVAKQTDRVADFGDPNPATICFVHNRIPECNEKALFTMLAASLDPSARLFYSFRAARVVYADPARAAPRLMVSACGLAGINGNCGILTFLFQYDRASDRFRLVFHDVVPRNNNGATRFVESGSLQGNVISAVPTGTAPYGYFVSVYRQDPTGRYARILRYRSRTHYHDGNRLAVIDSDMPEILRRLGLWKSSDPLPDPAVMPQGCAGLVLRDGEEWCG